ncbi:uncharacterized protein LOC135471363 [Liolophura sinensis]|uniref:uncharacterized protein LOC135471363 n=1 Tax=Liolophura sinensis TaxID=3198878 RepID=UPI00315913EA
MEFVQRIYGLCLIWLMVVGTAVASPTMPCGEKVVKKFIPDSDDCSVYYICSHGVSTRHICGENEAFYGHMCFPKFSKYDLCNKYRAVPFSSKLRRLQETTVFRTTCQEGESGLFPHPLKCALYYNCSDYSGNLRKPFLNECPSPLLFDPRTGSCLQENLVDCGTERMKPSGQCDYLRHQCLTSHGMPCGVLMPSCHGLPDGPNAWTDRLESPHYIECKQGSLVGKYMCGWTNDGGRHIQSIFLSKARTCGRV